MREKEVEYFTEAFKLTQNQFYVDAISKFKKLIIEYPESDLADDALYNIGFCYYEMNQFQMSIQILEEMIGKYPDATITAIEGGNAFGKTAAKAYYLIVQCHIGNKNIKKAESIIPILDKHSDTFILNNEEKIYFSDLAQQSIKTFKRLIEQDVINKH
jgi:tetratricopeptide (TPR) repeat protein